MSARRRADIGLLAKIYEIHRLSRGRYGSPNIHAELGDDHDIHVGCKRVARLMRESGLKSVVAPHYVVTTVAGAADAIGDDLVEREFWAATIHLTG
jgi:transposase InsO family protein